MNIWACTDDEGIFAVFTDETDAHKMIERMQIAGASVVLRTDYDGSGAYGDLAVDVWGLSK